MKFVIVLLVVLCVLLVAVFILVSRDQTLAAFVAGHIYSHLHQHHFVKSKT